MEFMIMKRKIIVTIAALFILGVGFFAGMEYKAYQVRTAFEDAFDETTASDSSDKKTTTMEEAKKENMVLIPKPVGEEIKLATINVKVTGSEEQQTISSSYSSPKVAKEGTKFVIVSMEVTNTTDSEFSLPADFLLIDNKKREFSTYSDSIGGIENYLDYRELSPSVKETGVYVYEVPTDATSYSIAFAKAGSKDLYTIKLK